MEETYTIELTAEQIDIVIDSMDAARRSTYDFDPVYSNNILQVAMEIARQVRESKNDS